MEKKDKRYLLQIVLYVLIIVIFFILPPISAITVEGMRLLGLFIAFIYGLTVTEDV